MHKASWCNQAYRYDSAYPAGAYTAKVPARGVLHSTETGLAVPSYSGGSKAPHVTGLPDMANRRITWYQHFGFDRMSRALAHPSGTVETNRLRAFQVELVGFCDRQLWEKAGRPGIYWPEAPSWALDEVAAMMRRVEGELGIARSSLPAQQWATTYGTGSKARFSEKEWTDFGGWCAHGHVPGNSHWDPGKIDIDYLLGDAPGALEDEVPEPIATLSLDGHVWVMDPRSMTLTRVDDPDDLTWFDEYSADMGIPRKHYEVAPYVLSGWRRVYVRQDVTELEVTPDELAAKVAAAVLDEIGDVASAPELGSGLTESQLREIIATEVRKVTVTLG